MFIRSKTLGVCPVFNTPEIRLWSNEIVGYTAGLTACTPVYDQKDPTKLLGYENVGVQSKDIYHSAKLITKIPGDNIAYYGRRNDQTEDPKPVSLAFGSIVLPTKYKGITLDNTVTGMDGNLYYKYVKGVYPESVSRFLGPFDRADYGFATQGITAGVSETDVALFPVYYSDEFNQAINDNKDVLFSIGNNINMPEGVWNAEADSYIGGCAPCRVNNPIPNGYPPFRCFNIPLTECGGGEVPYSAFQAIPENINVLSLSLALCTDKNDESPVLSITDSYDFDEFSVQKARLATKNSCTPEIPDCSDDNTLFKYECDGYPYNQICGSAPAISVPYYTDVGGIGFGLNEAQTINCLKFEEVSCSNPCANFNCNDGCPSYQIVVETLTYRRFQSYDCCGVPGRCQTRFDDCAYDFEDRRVIYTNVHILYPPPLLPNSFTPDPLCGWKSVDSDPVCGGIGGSEINCDYAVYEVSGCGTVDVNFDLSTYVRAIRRYCDGRVEGGVNTNPNVSTKTYSGSCAGDELGNRCCCGDGGGKVNTVPNPKNIVIKKVDQTDVKFEVNPYLMFNDDGKYFTVYDPNIKEFKPDFGKYLEEHLNVWKQDRSLYPEAVNYTLYFKNPKCFDTCIRLPDIFFLDESCFKSIAGAGVNCRALCSEGLSGGFEGNAFDGVEEFYDEEICARRINNLPTIDAPNYRFFDTDPTGGLRARRRPFCNLNKKHSGIDLNKQSFELACKEEYQTNPPWQNLEKYYEMEIRKQYGICNGDGVTLDIRYPIGLTLTDCTNIMSWEFLSNAPKRPNPL